MKDKTIQQKNRKGKTFLLILAVLLMFISVGYAILSTTLNINGTSSIKNATWDIHFENLNVTTGSVALSTGDEAATINSTNKTSVTYKVTLKKPGDFYEFTVDVKNDGTIDGMIDSVTSKMNDIEIDSLPSYLNYSVTYNDGKRIAENHLLSAGGKETYKVRVEYKKDINAADLPVTDSTLSFEVQVNYVQANEEAIDRNSDRYVYRNNTSIADSGANLSSLGTTYNTYNALVSALSKNYFLRHKVEGTQVVESSVGFVLSGTAYYLTGGGVVYDPINDSYSDSIYFEENVATLKAAFGESNCTEEEGFYECSVNGVIASAASDGGVDVGDASNMSLFCDVGPDGSSYCA